MSVNLVGEGMDNLFTIILAAGQGTRMKSKKYKVLHEIAGISLVEHVVREVKKLFTDKIIIVVGHGAKEVQDQLGNSYLYALQEKQLGTGHATLQAKEILQNERGTTLVLYGDTPLITAKTLQEMLSFHKENKNVATVLTTDLSDPTGYGRIVRRGDEIERIVEQKDATEEEKKIKEVNTGIYFFDNQALFRALEKVTNDNAQGEYYLTDCIKILKNEGNKVGLYKTDNYQETLGINDRVQLAQAEEIMRDRILKEHMLNGVTIIDPKSTYIEKDVEIGQDSVIYPGSYLRKKTIIGTNCVVGPNVDLSNVLLGENSQITHSVAIDSKFGNFVVVGPFAYIRPNSEIADYVKIGDFVEIKNTIVGEGTKIPHLSYIGDADVGRNVNIGCGSITVNFNGFTKNRTIIEDKVFVGCNTNLIAPIRIEESAYIAAGSTLTDRVPAKSLAIARAKQVNKEGYVDKIKEKYNQD